MSCFQISWYRFLPFLGYHHVLMIILGISIILLSILIAGCTNESLNGIYLVSWSYADSVNDGDTGVASIFSDLASNSSALEVRVGYLGMCVKAAEQWICSKGPEALEAYASRLASDAEVGDPLHIIAAADKFQSEVIFVALFIVSIAFAFFAILVLGTFPNWHEETDSEGSTREVKPFPSRQVSYVVFALAALSSILCLLSSFWQHLSSSAASTMAHIFTYSTVTCRVGAGAMVLGWLSVFLLLLVSVGLLIMILSIRVLNDMGAGRSGSGST